MWLIMVLVVMMLGVKSESQKSSCYKCQEATTYKYNWNQINLHVCIFRVCALHLKKYWWLFAHQSHHFRHCLGDGVWRDTPIFKTSWIFFIWLKTIIWKLKNLIICNKNKNNDIFIIFAIMTLCNCSDKN